MHKTNVLTHAGDLWQRTFAEVGQEFPDVTADYLHVDAAAMFLVTAARAVRRVVTDNLFGDILTDLAAAVTGGIGLAASGNINPERAAPSMFEPVHGSRPGHRRPGQGRPDRRGPVGRPCCCDHLGFTAEAARIEQAVAADLVERRARGRRDRPRRSATASPSE